MLDAGAIPFKSRKSQCNLSQKEVGSPTLFFSIKFKFLNKRIFLQTINKF